MVLGKCVGGLQCFPFFQVTTLAFNSRALQVERDAGPYIIFMLKTMRTGLPA